MEEKEAETYAQGSNHHPAHPTLPGPTVRCPKEPQTLLCAELDRTTASEGSGTRPRPSRLQLLGCGGGSRAPPPPQAQLLHSPPHRGQVLGAAASPPQGGLKAGYQLHRQPSASPSRQQRQAEMMSQPSFAPVVLRNKHRSDMKRAAAPSSQPEPCQGTGKRLEPGEAPHQAREEAARPALKSLTGAQRFKAF